MLYFIITLLAIANGIANAQDCSKEKESVCESSYDLLTVPDSVEEFKQICKKFQAAADCEFNYERKCGKHTGILEMTSEVQSLAQEVCGEFTLLNAALIENFACLKREMFDEEKYICDLPSKAELRRQSESLFSEMITDNLENEDPYHCLVELNIKACGAIEIEKQCGTIAMHAIMDILRRAPLRCKNEFEMLPALIRIRKLEEETGESLIKRKK